MYQNKKLVFFVILAILGMIGAVQVKSILYANNKQKTESQESKTRLIKEILNEKQTSTKLSESIKKLETMKEKSIKETIDKTNSDVLISLKSQLDNVKKKAGLTDVRGEGVVIMLDDAQARIDVEIELLIIHDRDVVRVVNELKKAGAQAISVNNERIISLSEQVCAGPTILINKRRYTTPFEIKAIGDPDKLYDELNASKIVYYLMKDKIRVNIEKSNEVVIPKYNNPNMDSLFSGLEVIKNEAQ